MDAIVHQQLNNSIMYKFNFLSVLILGSVLFTACTSVSIESEVNEYPVTFKVLTMSVEDEPMNARATTRAATTSSGNEISDVINEIHYLIYNGYDLVKMVSNSFDPTKETPPTGFGTLKVNLSPGTYDIYVFAGGKGSGSFEFKSLNPLHDNMNVYYNNKELFYYHNNFIVGNSATEHDVTVNRRCAALRVNVTEPIPENVGKVEYKIKDYPDWYFRRNSVYSSLETYTFQATVTDNKLDLFDYYYMAYPGSISTDTRNVSFLIYDKNNTLLFEKTLEINISKNRRTVISGSLFSSLNADDLTITVSDIWDDDISVVIE